MEALETEVVSLAVGGFSARANHLARAKRVSADRLPFTQYVSVRIYYRSKETARRL